MRKVALVVVMVLKASGAQAAAIDWVTVGEAGNTPDSDQQLPERVLRSFSRHADAKSLDRYSKPTAQPDALRAAIGPTLVPLRKTRS